MRSTAPAKGWGGRRQGSGRRPIGLAPQRPVTVTLPTAMVDRLRAYGGGNLSAGLRRLFEESALGASEMEARPGR